MKLKKNSYGKNTIVPSEKEWLCRIDDKTRHNEEVAQQELLPEEDRSEVQPIYKFKEAYIPDDKTIDDYLNIFVEID